MFVDMSIDNFIDISIDTFFNIYIDAFVVMSIDSVIDRFVDTLLTFLLTLVIYVSLVILLTDFSERKTSRFPLTAFASHSCLKTLPPDSCSLLPPKARPL